MSAQAATSGADHTHEDFYGERHPVRHFVIAIAAASALLVLVWWTGASAPRFSTAGGSGEFDSVDGSGTFVLDLENDAPTAVRILDVQSADEAIAVTAATLDGMPLADEPELGGGGSSRLRVEYRADGCVARTSTATEARLRIRVETLAGTSRTVTVAAALPVSDAMIPSC